MEEGILQNIKKVVAVTFTTAACQGIIYLLKLSFPTYVHLEWNSSISFPIILLLVLSGMALQKIFEQRKNPFMKERFDSVFVILTEYLVENGSLKFLVTDYGSYIGVAPYAFCPKCSTQLMQRFTIIGSRYYCPGCHTKTYLWKDFSELHHEVALMELGRKRKERLG